MEKITPPHVVILTSPGLGHLIPFVELADRLFRHHHFSVTFIAHRLDPPSAIEQSLLDALPKEVNVVSFHQLPIEALPEDAKFETRIFLSVMANLPRLRSLLASITSLAALVVDTFCVGAFDVATELGVPPFVFFTSTCMCLSLSFHLPALDASFQGDYRDLPEPVRLPGCVPFHGKELPHAGQDRTKENSEHFILILRRLQEAKGILVNSFEELEPGASKALKEGKNHPPVYPVGPLARSGSRESDQNHECLKWLNGQPDRSVVYVSFGSAGALGRAQMTELALGLEMSGKRFLWVVKMPNDHEACASYFSIKTSEDPLQFLPEGFLERTKGRGFLIPFWAPQAVVLRHAAIGGFVTHCGWNSTLESLVNGVPMIAWPLFADQRLNAVLLTEDAKVALRPKEREDGLFVKEEIASVVKSLMEGEEGKRLRKRATELHEAAARALRTDEGSSFVVTSEIARVWKKNQNKN